MCGIVGKVNFHGSRPVEESLIKAMAKSLAHRGPDDHGCYVDGPVGLGHRRLSIIDVSSAGHQPMSNAAGTIWITYNGEIYNFPELKQALIERGRKFRTATDTEVIIQLYEEYGEQAFTRLRGMFAFAIWDQPKSTLFLVRDRIGKKPLKYFRDQNGITFASELKALLQDPSIPTTIDLSAIHHYLTLQYVPHPLTGFVGIQKLPPGHYLKVTAGQATLHRYWQLDFQKKTQMERGDVSSQILKHLEEAVRVRLISDVPLGAFLSGGVDSSAVVAMMAKQSSRPVKTFSIGFTEKSHSELPAAKSVSDLFGTDHTEFIVQPQAIDVLDQLVQQFEEPYADSSAIPTFYLSQMTRQHVTVALNGDGGDESFAGYPWYTYHLLAERFRRWQVAQVVGRLSPAARLVADRWPSTTGRRAAIFLSSLRQSAGQGYCGLFTSSYFTDREKQAAYQPTVANAIGLSTTSGWYQQNVYDRVLADTALDRAQASDIDSYLTDDLLVKVDLASMAVGLEARSPFLDHEFLEFSATIPSAMKMPAGRLKGLLKEALVGVLPDSVLNRPKQGFQVPLGAWFRGELRETMKQQVLASDAKIHRLLRPAFIQRLVNEHLSGRIDHGSRLWSLLTLERWMQLYRLDVEI